MDFSLGDLTLDFEELTYRVFKTLWEITEMKCYRFLSLQIPKINKEHMNSKRLFASRHCLSLWHHFSVPGLFFFFSNEKLTSCFRFLVMVLRWWFDVSCIFSLFHLWSILTRGSFLGDWIWPKISCEIPYCPHQSKLQNNEFWCLME